MLHCIHVYVHVHDVYMHILYMYMYDVCDMMVSDRHMEITPALDETLQVRRWSLARGEELSCSLLSQLWPAVPATTGYRGMAQTGQATIRCVDS